jgi:Dolichyl-phosphate-mannose-protein mannosyltransferase
LWGLLGLAAVYFATRRWFGSPTALLTTILLAVTPTTIYFVRYPTTEPLTLLLIFSGLHAFQTLYDDPQSGILWGISGGMAWGAAFLTRIDLPVVLLLLIIALIAVRARRRWSRGWTVFTLTLGLSILYMILDVLFINWPYFWNTYSNVFTIAKRLLPLSLVGTTGLVFLGLAVLIMRRREIELSNLLRSEHVLKAMRALCVAAIIGLSVYAYFIRPTLEPVSFFTSWPGNVQVPVLNAQNWVRVGWYLTPLGVLLATIGVAWIVWRESLKRLALFLAVGLLTTIQYNYNILNMPYHIYAMRRYVPIVIPMLTIYTAYALVQLYRCRPRYMARVGAMILTLALLAGLVFQARYVLPQRDFFGMTAQLDQLNAHLKPDAIVLMSESSTENMADTFGVPLRFTYDHNIATVRVDDATAEPFLDRLLAYAAEHNQPVQLLALNPVAAAVRQSLQLRPAGEVTLRTSVLAPTFYEYPSVNQPIVFSFEIYDVLGKRTPGDPHQSLFVDIGTSDMMFIRSGFYSKDTLPEGTSARWTSDQAAIDLPLSTHMPVTVEVRAMSYRPETLSPANVIVYLDNREIGQFTPNETWQTYSFVTQPRPIDGFSRLEFRTPTFNPANLQQSGDNRDLGFLLDSVSIVLP